MKWLVKEVLYFETTQIHNLKTICHLKNLNYCHVYVGSANF